MSINIKPIRCMVELARFQSFTRAADKLNMTQPSLSGQISQLERNLGFQLFERSTRHVRLTREGQRLLEHAERLVEEGDRFQDAVHQIGHDVSNRLRIGASLYTFSIPERRELIEDFIDQYPDVDLSVDSHQQIDIMDGLTSARLDIAILIGVAMDGDMLEKSRWAELVYPKRLVRHILRSERVDLLVAEEDPLSRYDEIPAEMLRGQRVIMPSEEHGTEIIGAISGFFEDCSAVISQAPEGTATATERYGAKFRIPCVSFGWFNVPDQWRYVRRSVQGLNIATDLSILSNKDNENGAVNKFISFAKRKKPRGG